MFAGRKEKNISEPMFQIGDLVILSINDENIWMISEVNACQKRFLRKEFEYELTPIPFDGKKVGWYIITVVS